MRRRILHAFAAATFLWMCRGAVAIGQSEVFVPSEALPGMQAVDSAALDDLLRQGYALERRRQWADALLHYEEAHRSHPDQRDLEQRLQVVRIHFDLARRYADASFVASTRRLTMAESLDLLNEVFVKIQSHYYEPPNWQTLVERGHRHLEVALGDSEFLAAHGIAASRGSIEEFSRYLRQTSAQRVVAGRQDALAFVQWVGQLGEAQLGLPPVAAVLEYVCGAAGSLDEYSTFLTPEQLDDVYSQIEGNFVGLGIELKSSGGELLITNVIRGGPAFRAGMQAGDRITEVDGLSMRDLSTEKAADLLKGEQGSMVDVTVAGEDGLSRRMRVRRERVEVPSVEDVQLLDPQAGIGYFKVTSFQKTTSRDVDAALWKLQRQGMRSLIVDVRGNPGGLLTESVDVADKFVMDGTIVATRGRSPREDFDYKAHRVGTWRVALVVLIDGDSASASEIFAGAIRDHRRGTVVGNRSYGKGSVQGIFPLRVASSGVRLTTAKFYSPSGRPISGKGVEPDILVGGRPAAYAAETSGSDAVLAAALQVARDQVAQR